MKIHSGINDSANVHMENKKNIKLFGRKLGLIVRKSLLEQYYYPINESSYFIDNERIQQLINNIRGLI